MKKLNIFRIVPSNSKKISERFDARLRGVTIERVETQYKENGEIERVDIFYVDGYKPIKLA